MVALAEMGERDALDREVVGLAAAGREDDALGFGAEQRRDPVTGLLDRLAGHDAVSMRA